MRITIGVVLCSSNPKYGNIKDRSMNVIATNRTIIRFLGCFLLSKLHSPFLKKWPYCEKDANPSLRIAPDNRIRLSFSIHLKCCHGCREHQQTSSKIHYLIARVAQTINRQGKHKYPNYHCENY